MEESYFASVDDVLKYFGTDVSTGLTPEQVIKNRRKYGANEMPPDKSKTWLELVLKQFEDLLVLILLGSAFVSLALGLLENEGTLLEVLIEPGVILTILILNAIVGVWQESSAEEAIERLKEYEAKEALVLRGGEKITVDRSELVPGDLVLLKVGEKVPADCRLVSFQSRTVRTNESMLTGESVPQLKQLRALRRPRAGSMGSDLSASSKNLKKGQGGRRDKSGVVDQDKKNMVFSGTLLVHGQCRSVVVLTGPMTSMGEIQKGLSETDDSKTPLGEKLDEFAELLSKVILIICIAVWLINFNHFSEHGDWWRGAIYYFKIAVALAVAAIPEGLPAVVTTCLALGTRKMAKKNAIVRSLPSVETLGCTTVICSDKTGTLTTNQMVVRKIMSIEDVIGKKNLQLHHFNVTGTTFEPRGDVIDADEKVPENALLSFPAEKPSLRWISMISTMCNDASLGYHLKDGHVVWEIKGEPTEAALLVMSEKLHLPDAEQAQRLAKRNTLLEDFNAVSQYWNDQLERKHLLEFTRKRKSMSVFVRNKRTSYGWLLVKGAPEMILERSTQILVGSSEQTVPMNSNFKKKIDDMYHDFASEGLRCLALAYKQYKPGDIFEMDRDDYASGNVNDGGAMDEEEDLMSGSDEDDYAQIESGLTFVGIVGMLDPPRKEVKRSIQVCNRAGIRVIVITGDNKKTAEAICKDIGLFGKLENLQGKSYTGIEFMKLSQREKKEAVQRASLFSRVMPSHKSELVSLLKGAGEVVAMTGDGVNDAPALKKADIGVSMGSGTAVARHASDMVLEDDNFATIVSAVEEGRAIYANTKQFIRYLISSNIGEVACIFLTAAMGLPEALIPVQLLWVNLVTDGLPATALGFNKPDRDIMNRPPRGRTEKIINGWMFFRYFLIGIYIGVATIIGFVWWFVYYEQGPRLSYGQLTHFHACGLGTESDRFYFSDPQWKKPGACEIFRDNRPSTVSLSILVTIEMFNTFNALSENQSLLVNPPWANIWVVLAVTLSFLLHFMILYVEFFRNIFGTAASNWDEWMAVLVISFPVILLDEILKLVSRQIEASQVARAKKEV